MGPREREARAERDAERQQWGAGRRGRGREREGCWWREWASKRAGRAGAGRWGERLSAFGCGRGQARAGAGGKATWERREAGLCGTAAAAVFGWQRLTCSTWGRRRACGDTYVWDCVWLRLGTAPAPPTATADAGARARESGHVDVLQCVNKKSKRLGRRLTSSANCDLRWCSAHCTSDPIVCPGHASNKLPYASAGFCASASSMAQIVRMEATATCAGARSPACVLRAPWSPAACASLQLLSVSVESVEDHELCGISQAKPRAAHDSSAEKT